MNYTTLGRRMRLLIGSIGLLVLSNSLAIAGPKTQAGPYIVEVTTEPKVVSVGKAKLYVEIRDGSGQPVSGATVRALTKMPTMDMGERELPSSRASEQPGVYEVPAQFAMEGSYESTIRIDGPLGSATARVPLRTGQDTTASVKNPISAGVVVGSVLVLLVLVLVASRIRRAGQSVAWKSVLNKQVLGGLFLLVVITAGAMYAVKNLRRPGALTPVEAQAMDMSYLPPPPGYVPVELATVTRGKITSTVCYTGTSVGFVEQEVYPRVTGTLLYMPFYAGDHIRKGQVIARLDTSQIAPQAAEKQAAADTARQGISVAQAEAEQAEAEVGQAHAELAGKQGALRESQAGVAAAREERVGAQAALVAARAQGEDARAQIVAARADQTYWQAQIARSASLLKDGAISGEEFQRDKAQADTAEAKVQQAQARVSQVGAGVRSAEAALHRSEALIASAEARVQMARSELDAHYSHVRSAQAAVTTASRKVSQARSGAAEARAGALVAATARGYAEIHAEVSGVVTQRLISPGVLVAPGQAILRLAQLDPIRLQANVAASDLARIRVGNAVQIRTQDDTRAPVAARVASIAPSVDPSARTAVVEAVVSNHDQRFVPGQFVVMDIATGARLNVLRVTNRALRYQTASSEAILASTAQPYVWVAEASGPAGQYTVRRAPVQVGITDGQTSEIVGGVSERARVVVSGGTDLKDGDAVASASPGTAKMPTMIVEQSSTPAVAVSVTAAGFQPGTITLRAGVPVRITFTRTTNQTCATEVVFPEYGIKEALPLNQPVTVVFTPKKGTIGFACGMNMVKGKVVAQ